MAPYTAHCTQRKESQAADWGEKTCCLLFRFFPSLCFTVCLCLCSSLLKGIFTTFLPFSPSFLCCLVLSVSQVCSVLCVESYVLSLCSEQKHTLMCGSLAYSLPLSISLFSLSLSGSHTDYYNHHVTQLWQPIGCYQVPNPPTVVE